MKLDMSLVRQILIHLEDMEETLDERGFLIEEYSKQQMAYHVELMVEGGLLKSNLLHNKGGETALWRSTRPTWDGHQFIMAARDEKRWKRFLKQMGNQSSNVPFAVATRILSQLALLEFGIA